MNRSLPVVVVGVSARSAAQSLARSQIRCVTIDQFGDQDTLRSAQISHVVQADQQLAETLKQYPTHPVVCVGQWPGMIETIQQSDTQPLIDAKTWRTASSFNHLEIAAMKAGLAVPFTSTTRPSGKTSSTILQKQTIHSGGLGIRWNRLASLSATDNVVYQQWIPGRSYGATFLGSDRGVQLLGICRNLFRRIADFPFVYKGSVGPTDNIELKSQAKLLVAAETIVLESGLRGVFSLDFIQSAGGKISLLEINPRWSASSEIIERSLTQTGAIHSSQSLMQISIDAMQGKRVATLKQKSVISSPWIKRIIYAKHPMYFNDKKAIDVAKEVGSLHDIPADDCLTDSQHPVCTLIAKTDPAKTSWWSIYRNAIHDLRTQP
ncbi:ATP-grasp domain protein [Rubripirellula obstinata]|uniref:ATP-grasp domain protein n=1 Tax=Rubripirellula obstinata TaxID=406547 RepID=A0A5B1CQP5_9BACT|nr:ATP-grasp domain-containing protein [Rubripirellula obstinata]KAA1262285.1 ATP-grasp domain protein [Rubripirellula obstinata]